MHRYANVNSGSTVQINRAERDRYQVVYCMETGKETLQWSVRGIQGHLIQG